MSFHVNPAPTSPGKINFSSEPLVERLKKINQLRNRRTSNISELQPEVQYIAQQIERYESDKEWGSSMRLTFLDERGEFFVYLPKEYGDAFLDEDIIAINEGKVFLGLTYKRTEGKRNKRFFSVDIVNIEPQVQQLLQQASTSDINTMLNQGKKLPASPSEFYQQNHSPRSKKKKQTK